MKEQTLKKARVAAGVAYDLIPTAAAFDDAVKRAIQDLAVLETAARGPLSVSTSSYDASSAVAALLTPIYEARRGIEGAYGAVGGRLSEPVT